MLREILDSFNEIRAELMLFWGGKFEHPWNFLTMKNSLIILNDLISLFLRVEMRVWTLEKISKENIDDSSSFLSISSFQYLEKICIISIFHWDMEPTLKSFNWSHVITSKRKSFIRIFECCWKVSFQWRLETFVLALYQQEKGNASSPPCMNQIKLPVYFCVSLKKTFKCFHSKRQGGVSLNGCVFDRSYFNPLL